MSDDNGSTDSSVTLGDHDTDYSSPAATRGLGTPPSQLDMELEIELEFEFSICGWHTINQFANVCIAGGQHNTDAGMGVGKASRPPMVITQLTAQAPETLLHDRGTYGRVNTRLRQSNCCICWCYHHTPNPGTLE